VNFMSAGRVEKRGMYIREPRRLQRFFLQQTGFSAHCGLGETIGQAILGANLPRL
jgi:hypothetical protein